ncbi:MAG: hypothetical protein FJ290_09860 [Planctomycetes bacterium]|nr:hypothetical protein [Planctomycetota bacterium]
MRRAVASAVVAPIALLAALSAPAGERLAALLDAYAPKPQGYPTGQQCARPDTSAPFRWHFYHEGAVERFDDAKMRLHADPFNPLDGEGPKADPRSPVKLAFVAERATEGKQALRADFPASAVQAGKAAVSIAATAGPPSFSAYLRSRGYMPTGSCYWPHYRWLRLDAFNPQEREIRVRVANVPLVLHPGANAVAVKTADAMGFDESSTVSALGVEVVAPAEDTTLFLDNVRMEQEVPTAMKAMLQFPARDSADSAPLLWPGFTPVEADMVYSPERGHGWTAPKAKRQHSGHSFRSHEPGLLWGWCSGADCPFRIDLPNGAYGVYILAAPGRVEWPKGVSVKLNGKDHLLLSPRTEAEVRQMALGGEAWDFRPGACVWEGLVRPAYYPSDTQFVVPPSGGLQEPRKRGTTNVLYAAVTEGHLLIEFPPTLALRAIMVFAAADKDEALKQIGRLNYLLAEAWDVSHPWVKGSYAEKIRYIGFHDEMIRPETIPDRLAALKLSDADFDRGFVLFHRGLAEPVYPDTIPTPQEVIVGGASLPRDGHPRGPETARLQAFAAPGEREAVTLGILPLAPVKGIQVKVSDLAAKDARIPADRIDMRVARYHQKTMQFGHHNHPYNYQEHYLVRAPIAGNGHPSLDLWPGAARRIYLDIAVPADARPGEYAAQVTIASAEGKPLATVPLALEVLPIALKDPPVYFAANYAHPLLKDHGFNTFQTSYDDAVRNGYRGFIPWVYESVPGTLKGKRIHWNNLLASKELVGPVIAEGREGKGPRGFFGGAAPATHGKPNAAEIARQFFDQAVKEFPQLDILNVTVPIFCSPNGCGQDAHEWQIFQTLRPPVRATPEALEAARQAGKDFWFADALRHSKEQAARFTFGLWLWRLGATGRYTTLDAHLQYGYGTARLGYRWDPYFTLLDVTTCNIDRALIESVAEGQWNPSRDLLLHREGIDDFRYIHTLDTLIKEAEAKKAGGEALAAARKFRDALFADLSLDLTKYYESRNGAYGENWYTLPTNPWTTAKLNATRRAAAAYIIALRSKPR